MNELINVIQQSVPLTSQEIDRIVAAFKTTSLKKGDLWIREGQYVNEIAFVHSGSFRNFYYNELGEEMTCFFVFEGEFGAAYSSFLTRLPTTENMIAMEDMDISVITRDRLETLSAAVPKMHIWRRIVAENLFILMERRIAMLQSKNARARYEALIEENPDLLLRVPLQYTASFLGITPQHLSRLRKQKSR